MAFHMAKHYLCACLHVAENQSYDAYMVKMGDINIIDKIATFNVNVFHKRNQLPKRCCSYHAKLLQLVAVEITSRRIQAKVSDSYNPRT